MTGMGLRNGEALAVNVNNMVADDVYELERRPGPLVIDLPRRHVPVITTDYMAQRIAATHPWATTLREAVAAELTTNGW